MSRYGVIVPRITVTEALELSETVADSYAILKAY